MYQDRIGREDPREIPFLLESLDRGGYLLWSAEKLLLQLIFDWPRRNRRMLLTGCGAGLFLEPMYRAGFDVTGQDSHPHFVTRARLRLGQAADLHLGSSECLQFDDNHFDYVAILFTLNMTQEPEAVLQEAYRVAKRGILAGMLNRCPVPTREEADQLGIESRDQELVNAVSWNRLKKMLRRWVPFQDVRARSVLPGPQFTWKDAGWANRLNRPSYPPDWGAFYAVRTDLQSECSGLPLRALSTKPEIV